MSRPYGPVPLTAGIVTFQDIDPGAAWVVIENSSLSFDLGVCFQVNAPPVVTTFSGPPWDGVIQAGGWRKFQLPSTANNQQWTGRIWVLPIDVSGLQASSGAISGYSRVYMTTYLPGEEPADAPTIIRALDVVSQLRVVQIPYVFSQPLTGVWNPVTDASLSILSTPLSAHSITYGQVVGYLADFLMIGYGDTGAAWALNFVIEMYVYDATHTVIIAGPATLQTLRASAQATGAANVILPGYPASPWSSTLSWGSGAPEDVLLKLTRTAIVGAPLIAYNVNFSIDKTNITPPGGIGDPGPHVKPGIVNPNVY